MSVGRGATQNIACNRGLSGRSLLVTFKRDLRIEKLVAALSCWYVARSRGSATVGDVCLCVCVCVCLCVCVVCVC